jgi:hypothetical protein
LDAFHIQIACHMCLDSTLSIWNLRLLYNKMNTITQLKINLKNILQNEDSSECFFNHNHDRIFDFAILGRESIHLHTTFTQFVSTQHSRVLN